MYSYAMQNDIVNKYYAEYVEVGEKEYNEEIPKPFTKKEIDILWENVYRMEFIDTILIMNYTGELIIIEDKDINIPEDSYVEE